MKKTLFLTLACLALTAGFAFAQGQNYGGQAYLSWSRDATVRDIPVACGFPQNLYIKLANIKEVKGVEFKLLWSPDEATTGMTYDTTLFPVSNDPTCTYLLRGQVAQITVQPNDGSSVAEAGAGDGITTACTFGNVAVVQIDFQANPGGCSILPQSFSLAYIKVTDHLGVENQMTVIGAASIGGATPVGPSTWGGIKALYR